MRADSRILSVLLWSRRSETEYVIVKHGGEGYRKKKQMGGVKRGREMVGEVNKTYVIHGASRRLIFKFHALRQNLRP